MRRRRQQQQQQRHQRGDEKENAIHRERRNLRHTAPHMSSASASDDDDGVRLVRRSKRDVEPAPSPPHAAPHHHQADVRSITLKTLGENPAVTTLTVFLTAPRHHLDRHCDRVAIRRQACGNHLSNCNRLLFIPPSALKPLPHSPPLLPRSTSSRRKQQRPNASPLLDRCWAAPWGCKVSKPIFCDPRAR